MAGGCGGLGLRSHDSTKPGLGGRGGRTRGPRAVPELELLRTWRTCATVAGVETICG